MFDFFVGVVMATYNRRKDKLWRSEPITLGNEREAARLGGYEPANEANAGMRNVLRFWTISGRGAARWGPRNDGGPVDSGWLRLCARGSSSEVLDGREKCYEVVVDNPLDKRGCCQWNGQTDASQGTQKRIWSYWFHVQTSADERRSISVPD